MRYSIIIIAIFGSLFMGCATQKRCFELYPPEIVTDSVEVNSIEYRDTIIQIILPGDTVQEAVTIVIPCPDPEDSVVLIPGPVLSLDTVHAVGEHAEASAWLEMELPGPAKLNIRLIEHEKILQVKLDSAIIESRYWKTMYHVEIHKEPPVIKIPWYYRASLPVAIILFLLLLFCLRYRR